VKKKITGALFGILSVLTIKASGDNMKINEISDAG
jgi:hypothetical protein